MYPASLTSSFGAIGEFGGKRFVGEGLRRCGDAIPGLISPVGLRRTRSLHFWFYSRFQASVTLSDPREGEGVTDPGSRGSSHILCI